MKEIDLNETLTHIQRYYTLLDDRNKERSVSILDIFGKTFSENHISDFLAYILNPQTNGIGLEPIKNLVMYADGEWLDEYENLDEDIIVNREFTFDDGRRIDLLIKLQDSLIIGIEHKVFSNEHGEQTIDYVKQIKSQFPNQQHVFIFLTPNKKEALAKDEFKAIGYGELIILLKQIQFDYLKDIKKSVLYNDFISHLEENFMKSDSLIVSEKTKLYLENAKMIEDLRKSFEEDYEVIQDFVLNMIKNHFEKHDGNEWFLNSNVYRNYQQITKKEWKSKGLDIHFEIKMSLKNLILKPVVEFMIDIEAPGKTQIKKEFIEKMEKNHSSEIDILIKRYQLKRFPRTRTFVSKEYELLTSEKIENQQLLKDSIEEMIMDFEGFIDILNKEISTI